MHLESSIWMGFEYASRLDNKVFIEMLIIWREDCKKAGSMIVIKNKQVKLAHFIDYVELSLESN